MFNKYRQLQFTSYNNARSYLSSNPSVLIELEKLISIEVEKGIRDNLTSISEEYNEASHLYPFWQNYPPDERGRAPKGDQFPWIEVGEHAIGNRLSRILSTKFNVADYALPTGADQRLLLRSDSISRLLPFEKSAVWLFSDIKSVGPRDDAEHTVMSHNQISGDGIWTNVNEGIRNSILTAKGMRASHDFHCSIPPIYVMSDGTIAPMINVALKPLYQMLHQSTSERGQPLKKISVITIPNGLLLTENPNYLKMYPGLLFPGKDDKEKNPLKVRARVSFDILKLIDSWRIKQIVV